MLLFWYVGGCLMIVLFVEIRGVLKCFVKWFDVVGKIV